MELVLLFLIFNFFDFISTDRSSLPEFLNSYNHLQWSFVVFVLILLISIFFNYFWTLNIVSKLNKKIDEQLNSKKEVDSKNLSCPSVPEHTCEKTKEMSVKNDAIAKELKDSQEAMLNILEDISFDRAISMKEKERLFVTLRSIGEGVMTTDANGIVTIFNKEAERISEFESSEVIGKHYKEIIKFAYEKDDSPANIFIENALTDKTDSDDQKLIFISKNNKKIPVSKGASPVIVNGELTGCIVVFRDVTKEREIDRQKSDFISIASHQLRSPVTAIKWYLELLNESKEKFSDETKEYISDMYGLSTKLIELVKMLLNISKLESGVMQMSPEDLDLNAIVSHIAEEYKNRIQDEGGNLILEINTKDLDKIKIDEILFLQILRNILDNAVKYSKTGEAKINLKLDYKDENNLIISIQDNGIGIPKDEEDKIFQRFFRAENAKELASDGTGLGLYLAKIITESYGGEIGFNSEEGKGTTFFFTIPKTGMITKK